MRRPFALAVLVFVLFAPPAWALFDMYEVVCTSSQHGLDGLRLGFPGNLDKAEADACKALAAHLKDHPRHKARVYFSDDGEAVPWDCVRHARAKQ